jgi:hypothetical protein
MPRSKNPRKKQTSSDWAFLFDANVWLALAFADHPHHRLAGKKEERKEERKKKGDTLRSVIQPKDLWINIPRIGAFIHKLKP